MSTDDTLTLASTAMANPLFVLDPVQLPSRSLEPDAALFAEKRRGFSIVTLAGAIYQGCTYTAIQDYLQCYRPSDVKLNESGSLPRHIIFYAINRNDVDCLRALLEFGANSKAPGPGKIPALAWAIMRCKWTGENALPLVKLLLAYGANPHRIPREMWINYIDTPTGDANGLTYTKDGASAWCTAELRDVLAETLNLSIRYSLWRASCIGPVKERKVQMAKAKKMTPLFKIPYLIVGQQFAVQQVIDTVFSHLTLNKERPLVLAFAGLSGHGKSELAGQLGSLLSADLVDIDCAQCSSVYTLIGGTPPYSGHKKGSPLNNFLARHSNKRCVVFLDEYDKTEDEVRDALLKVMDTGLYRDRRDNEEVNCSKVIWILATNQGDQAITQFHAKHLANKSQEEVDKVDVAPLREDLRQLFITLYSPAVAGRINAIMPFFPFSPNEQAVVAHKFILDLGDGIRKPIDFKEPVVRYIGHCHLSVVDDGRVCLHLAKKGYVQDVGARSLETAVARLESLLVTEYANTDKLVVQETNQELLQKFWIQLNPVSDDVKDISVYAEKE